MNYSPFLQKLKSRLSAEGFPEYDDTVLISEIDLAVFAINEQRRFRPTEEKPYDSKYDSLIVPMVVSAISKYGAEGQTGHGENNISRSYAHDGVYPEKLMASIIPLAR